MAMQCVAPPASIVTHTKTIGVIYPPPHIRTIVDKLATYVAKNGPDFQSLIMDDHAQNSKFGFLEASSPYHAYYQHRLSDLRCQSSTQPTQDYNTTRAYGDNNAEAKPDHSEQFRTVCKPLVPPEAEQYSIRLHEGITCEELDIIKLAAQFVALNGESFLSELVNRERNNLQFRFMSPTHSMFMFFTKLTDAYSAVLMPPKGLNDKLKNSVDSKTTILERCLCRLEWESSQEHAKQEAEDEMEQERLQMAMIDWHDFSGVVDIDFADDEDHNLPPPMTLEEVKRKSKSTKEIVEPGNQVQMAMDTEEVQLVEDGMKVASLEENGDDEASDKVILMEQDPPIRIVKNYRKLEERIHAERDPTKYVVSPITGELILLHEMAEHIGISLIDPKYKEQKERMFAKIRYTTLAQDDEIFENIMGLARSRPDIFGTTEEEVSSAVKAEIEVKKDEQPKQNMSQNSNAEDINDAVRILTGHAPLPRPSMPSIRPVPPPPGLAVNLHHSMNTVHSSISMNPPLGSQYMSLTAPQSRAPHLMPQHGMHKILPPPMSQGIVPPPPPEEALPPLPKEPEPKRQRLDDSLLIPEQQFLAQHQGPAHINVSVPNLDGGNLRGQVLEITVQSLSVTISSLKEKIAGEIQLPSNKQKLSGKAGFLKDNLSLAYYNVAEGGTLTLALRERGGRKR